MIDIINIIYVFSTVFCLLLYLYELISNNPYTDDYLLSNFCVAFIPVFNTLIVLFTVIICIYDFKKLNDAENRISFLENAIRKHRDQRGDDRCWMDDEVLYRTLPEGYVTQERDSSVELSLCKKYIESRHNPSTEYISPQRRIEELELENQKLKDRLPKAESRASFLNRNILELQRTLEYASDNDFVSLQLKDRINSLKEELYRLKDVEFENKCLKEILKGDCISTETYIEEIKRKCK